MTKKYRVSLSATERASLETLINKGKEAAHKRRHAQILLKADEGEFGPCWTDERIVEAHDVSRSAVEKLRERLVTRGLEAALTRATPDRSHKKKIDGELEAHLIALVCNDPPEGRVKWTLQLLADRMVELKYVETVSYETVRQTLKKTNLNLGKIKNGVLPRQRMPTLSAQWKTYWRYTRDRMTSTIRWCAWMKVASSK
jgi:Homeodomain-like domain